MKHVEKITLPQSEMIEEVINNHAEVLEELQEYVQVRPQGIAEAVRESKWHEDLRKHKESLREEKRYSLSEIEEKYREWEKWKGVISFPDWLKMNP